MRNGSCVKNFSNKAEVIFVFKRFSFLDLTFMMTVAFSVRLSDLR